MSVPCVVVAQFEDRRENPAVTRTIGERVEVPEDRLEDWLGKGIIQPIAPSPVEDWPWGLLGGAELRVPAEPTGNRHRRVVAALNVWNDRHMLEQTLPLWAPHVDHVIVVDGAYKGMPCSEAQSTDGLVEFLHEALPEGMAEVTYSLGPGGFWNGQNEKRSSYFALAEPGDVVFVVDADEFVEGAEALRQLESLDVGWLRVEYSAVYRRRYRQPRLFRVPTRSTPLEYRGRHHWVWCGERLMATHQYGGTGWDHRLVPLLLRNEPRRRPPVRQAQRAAQRQAQVAAEAQQQASSVSDSMVGARECLQVVQLTLYDPGCVVYRLHTALNTTTPHSSVFGRYTHDNPFSLPHQFGIPEDMATLKHALRTADVIHCHLSYHPLFQLGEPNPRPPVVIHHHGTMFRQSAEWREQSDRLEASLRLVSNLELLQYGTDLHFLPNPVPVAQYRALARAARLSPPEVGEPLRVAHSPSKRHLKGTDAFLEVCERLRSRGVLVEPVLIENLSHEEALRLKASCDVTFDSFWLGLQCSGLEAAAMGQPVLAGDKEVAARYREWLGSVPYTYVQQPEELEKTLERLYYEPEWRQHEAGRVFRYVLEHHDYAAVALRYLELLDAAVGWRHRMQV